MYKRQGKTLQASDGEPVTATGNIDSLDDIRAFAVALSLIHI